MDQRKTGQFIKTMRKEKALTQRELAEQLGISEKTVSKWETGSGLPEVSLMLPLCELLGINVNELLSGEKLEGSAYIEKAEENIVSLVSDRTSSKTKMIISVISCVVMLLSVLGIGLVMAFVDLPDWAMGTISILCVVMLFAYIFELLLVAVNTEIFECPHCKKSFVPTFWAYTMGVHTIRKRHLKCPHCGKRAWCRSRLRK